MSPWALMSVVGVLVFFVLYVLATLHYPGGSQFDTNSSGFSWKHNYWCNLLNEVAINGKVNTARPYAIGGMLVLGFSIVTFCRAFSQKVGRKAVFIFGLATMICSCSLLLNVSHDFATNLTSALGLLTLLMIMTRLYKIKWKLLFFFGLFNIALVIFNNLFYYSPALIVYLPILQKVSFVSFLVWISGVSLRL